MHMRAMPAVYLDTDLFEYFHCLATSFYAIKVDDFDRMGMEEDDGDEIFLHRLEWVGKDGNHSGCSGGSVGVDGVGER